MEKEYNNLDELLRKSLGNFQQKPNAGVWKRISSSLPGTGIYSIFSSKSFWVISGFALVGILFFFINFIYNPSSIINQNFTRQDESLYEEDLIPKPETDHGKSESKGTVQTIPEDSKVSKQTDGPKTSSIEYHEANRLDLSSEASGGMEALPANQINSTELKGITLGNDMEREIYLLNGYFPILIKKSFNEQVSIQFPFGNIPGQIPIRYNNESFTWRGLESSSRDDYGKKHNFLYGINFVPEIVFPGPGETNKGIGAELTCRYLLNDFYLETGLGFSLSENDGNYAINYDQYDSIGYYYKVTSFSINETTGQPVFNTGLETVFDTVSYQASETTKNTYRYLYFPFYGGVTLYQFKRLSLNLQAGVIYSLMISQNESTSDYKNDNATRISITNETPSRISSNWIMGASLGLQYELSQTVSLNFEPMVKYYFKPVYERKYETKQSYGLGFRVGLFFKF